VGKAFLVRDETVMLRENIERRRAAWERELVERMRRDDPEALLEFFRNFRPLLLEEARRLRVQPALRHEVVDECLDDVAMRLLEYTVPIPRSLAPYLVKAFRYHRLKRLQAELRRQVRERRGAPDDSLGDATVGTASEASVRDSAGPLAEYSRPAQGVERLGTMVEEGLTPEEETIMSWVAHNVSQTDMAEWLGTTPGAVRTRVWRLRLRLKETSLRYAAAFTGRERRELDDFFRRMYAVARGATRRTNGA
jgi:DNA-directed RNA polymerase specialized sigma24 family protein